MDKRTFKLISGGVLALFNLAVLSTGVYLIITCIPGIGEGKATAAVTFFGEVTGLNGHVVGIFIGAAMAISSMMYAYKAYKEALEHEPNTGTTSTTLPNIVRHHSPSQ